jgi:glycolate oxidase iron-sulfur subunit
MQINLASDFQNNAKAIAAEQIIRKCVHCGLCNATCPTYQLLGDELDGPRGRIYQIKDVLETGQASTSHRLHLDRCLTCRACETTCPSGVEYGELSELGKYLIEDRLVDQYVGGQQNDKQSQPGTNAVFSPRAWHQNLLRWVLKEGLTRPKLFAFGYRLGQYVRPVLPKALQSKISPADKKLKSYKPATGAVFNKQVLMLQGCVQPAMQPNIHWATEKLLNAIGVGILKTAPTGCCGAIRSHLQDEVGGLQDMKNLIDIWWPSIEKGIDAIVINASGCGLSIKSYGDYLKDDALYADKAKVVSNLAKDIAEYLQTHSVLLESVLDKELLPERISYHPPCTLQHGLKLPGVVEQLFADIGKPLQSIADSHLCCGSAGTYSVLQPAIATTLRDNKLNALAAQQPEAIISANIGCISHLQSGTPVPVKHWVEVLALSIKSKPTELDN